MFKMDVGLGIHLLCDGRLTESDLCFVVVAILPLLIL